MIYNNDQLICVFPCCNIENKNYSHKGSTCGGPIFHINYYKLDYIKNIINLILNYYENNLIIKISENIYYQNNYNNNLLIFLLKQKMKVKIDICMYINVKKKIEYNFNKGNKRLLKKILKKL